MSVRLTASVAATMKLTSGSLNFDSGVGTQIDTASGSARRRMSVVALKRPACTDRLQLGVAHVLDVGMPGVEAVDHLLLNIEAEHAEARVGQLDGQRQPDVAQPDDAEQRLPPLRLPDQILGDASCVEPEHGVDDCLLLRLASSPDRPGAR